MSEEKTKTHLLLKFCHVMHTLIKTETKKKRKKPKNNKQKKGSIKR